MNHIAVYSGRIIRPLVKFRRRLALLLWSLLALTLFLVWYFAFYRVYHQIELLKSDQWYYQNEVVVVGKIGDPKSSFNVDYNLQKEKPKFWVPLKSLPRFVPWAFVVSEDSFFYKHPGYDLEAMKMALHQALGQKKKLRGASTINQQLAKNLFLTRDRTLWRKGLELIYAVEMNKQLSKKRIMEIYLNVIEFGPGIYGIGQASQFYFKKNAAFLRPKEAAYLAMLLPSPKRYSQSYRDRRLSRFSRKGIQRVLRKLVQVGQLSLDGYIEQLSTPLAFERVTLADHQEFIDKAKRDVGIEDDEDDESDSEGQNIQEDI